MRRPRAAGERRVQNRGLSLPASPEPAPVAAPGPSRSILIFLLIALIQVKILAHKRQTTHLRYQDESTLAMQERLTSRPFRSAAGESDPLSCRVCPARRNGICELFDNPLLCAMNAISVERPVKKGAVVAASGEKSNAMFVIKYGEFKAVRTLPDGRRQIVGFAVPGDVIGGPHAERSFDCTIEALTDAVLCESRRCDVEPLSTEHPDLTRIFLSATFAELRRRNDQAVLLGRKNADQRLALFLLQRCNPVELDRDGGLKSGRATLTMSRSEIADYLGLTIETVSRTMSQFKGRGLIRISQSKKIDLIDAAGLQRLAGEEIETPSEARVFI